jgi:hypothetical protein
MANGTTDTLTSTAKKPWEMPGSQLDVAAAMREGATTAAQKVATPDIPGALGLVAPTGATTAEQSMISALEGSYQSQAAATKVQAEKAGGALETMGAATEQYIANIEAQQKAIPELRNQSVAMWNQVEEKADEYVQAARDRVGTALAKIDEINAKIADGRDFAKAHDMQAAVQGVLGQMNTEGRRIAETYGMGSAEYKQFEASKKSTLATVHSNITAAYHKLRESQDATYLAATNETQWKHNMYVSYQEQQHVETLRYMAQMQSELDLNLTQFQLQAEGLKMAGMENLSNWIVQTPAFAMDSTPFVAAALNIQATADARQMAEREMALAEKEAAKTMKYKAAPIQWLPGGWVQPAGIWTRD